MAIIRSNKFLWTLQILLALLYAFAGTSKFFMDPAQMAPPGSPVSAGFIRFIGVCECLGAIGLIVPQVTGILPRLTPIAAIGLVIIMIGAVTITLMTQPVSLAILPFVAGVLLCVVAYGRLQTYAAARHTSRV
jgi:uncharacterized membrane protein YphA (DoxX/SURF4 family)